MSLTVSVDIKQHWTVLRHWSQFSPNMSTDIQGHEAPLHLYVWLVVKAAKKLPHNWSRSPSARTDTWECRICGHACSRWSIVTLPARQGQSSDWPVIYIILIGQLYIVPLQLKCGVVWFWHFCRENDNETKKHCINIMQVAHCVIKRTNFTCCFAMPTPKPKQVFNKRCSKVLSYKDNWSSVAISPGMLITPSVNKKIFASKMFGLFRHAWQFGHVTKVKLYKKNNPKQV